MFDHDCISRILVVTCRILVAELSADNLCVRVVPEVVCTHSAPLSTETDFDASLVILLTISQTERPIDATQAGSCREK